MNPNTIREALAAQLQAHGYEPDASRVAQPALTKIVRFDPSASMTLLSTWQPGVIPQITELKFIVDIEPTNTVLADASRSLGKALSVDEGEDRSVFDLLAQDVTCGGVVRKAVVTDVSITEPTGNDGEPPTASIYITVTP